MTFKQNDLIEFEDNEKVVVLDAIEHKGNEYVFVNIVTGDNVNPLPTDQYKVMFVDYSNGTLQKIVDTNLLQELLPQFEARLKNQLGEEN